MRRHQVHALRRHANYIAKPAAKRQYLSALGIRSSGPRPDAAALLLNTNSLNNTELLLTRLPLLRDPRRLLIQERRNSLPRPEARSSEETKVKSKKGNGKRAGKAAKGATKIAKTETSRAGLIPLKKICSDLGLDPKASRVRLRRVWRKTDEKGKPEGNVAFHTKGARWDLTKAEAAEVRAILSPG